ncbi:hypothetical protein POM88_038030 [Heracleum sosnowskyi]|uniref:Small ribosomal subunit protein uS10 domain-containing protein n=1 Tax=Heracleum sosnowskyi TaxID=360622 RepID=A0AAD8HTF4_9APIA|nr:hypothetical protein POM88_038030 [Heracleum sosnowskyi]
MAALETEISRTKKKISRVLERVRVFPYWKKKGISAAVVRDAAKGMHLRVCGPSVLPNRIMNITVRLTTKGYHRTSDFEKQLNGRAVDVLSLLRWWSRSYLVVVFVSSRWSLKLLILGDHIPRAWTNWCELGNLSSSSSSFCPVMEETMEKQFQRILSLPSEPTKKQQFQNIRFSRSSRFLKCLDEVVAAIIRNAKGMHLMVWGPYILPTEVLNIEYRLAPSPEGINLVRNVESVHHWRVVDVLGSSELVEQIKAGVLGNHHVSIDVEVVDLAVLI